MSSLVLVTVFALYMLILIIIGWFSFRRNVGSAEDYFMAGRSFGTLVLFMSLFGTNVTAFALESFSRTKNLLEVGFEFVE